MAQTPNTEVDRLTEHLHEAQRLLSRRRLVENLVNRQEMPRHKLVESIVHKQNLGELGGLLNRLDAVDTARILEALPSEDRLLAWEQIKEDRLDAILLLLLDDVREELVNASTHQSQKVSLNAFDLHEGRLRQVKISEQGRPRQHQADLGRPGGAVRRNALLGRRILRPRSARPEQPQRSRSQRPLLP